MMEVLSQIAKEDVVFAVKLQIELTIAMRIGFVAKNARKYWTER